jgi:diaminohydroxyphosphoribosylaminopyrimidine deaminase/5-amino-6-(5-phosphoribosylamino)uracil reductase
MLRARHDAVMVGGGTARADDPALTVRDLGITRQPKAVVASAGLDLPGKGPLAARGADLVLCHATGADSAAWRARGATCLDCGADTPLDLRKVMTALADTGLTRVLCEGGGGLAAGLLRAGLVDDLVVFGAGAAIGADGVPTLAALGVTALSDAPRFTLRDLQAIGGDVMTRWARA